jgi:hypothetical protein
MASLDAPALKNPNHLSMAVTSHAYMASVGGVAFDGVAAPAGNLVVNSLSLDYLPDRADGARLRVTINNKTLSSRIYDWQLVPTAKFADSPYYSAVTLFGKLHDGALERKIRDSGQDIINYHPALENTLLGLRLFQFDVLHLDLACTDLPKQRGDYILGAGETAPDLRANGLGWSSYMNHVASGESRFRSRFRSYLICDHGRDIRFAADNGALTLSGDPFFYCWWLKSDDPGHNPAAARQRITADVDRQLQAARAARGKAFDEREWLIAALIEQVGAYEQGYGFYSAGTVVDLLKVTGEAARKDFLRKYYTASLRDLLIDLRAGMDSHQVVYLKEYSEWLSSRPELLRAINPAVWDAATSLMRYAAFFRFVGRDHAGQWQRFLRQVDRITPAPQVRTPNTWDRKMPGRQGLAARSAR